MAQTLIEVRVTDVGINPGGELIAEITVFYRGFGMEAKRQRTSTTINLTEVIANE